ncbi:hypothetical protein BC936DRAFT_147187, partial [Jimgerdemannia flammicorona]
MLTILYLLWACLANLVRASSINELDNNFEAADCEDFSSSCFGPGGFCGITTTGFCSPGFLQSNEAARKNQREASQANQASIEDVHEIILRKAHRITGTPALSCSTPLKNGGGTQNSGTRFLSLVADCLFPQRRSRKPAVLYDFFIFSYEFLIQHLVAGASTCYHLSKRSSQFGIDSRHAQMKSILPSHLPQVSSPDLGNISMQTANWVNWLQKNTSTTNSRVTLTKLAIALSA